MQALYFFINGGSILLMQAVAVFLGIKAIRLYLRDSVVCHFEIFSAVFVGGQETTVNRSIKHAILFGECGSG